MTPKIPDPLPIFYFMSSRDGCPHEMLGDRPARRKDGTMCALKDVTEGEDIEVFVESGWVPGCLRGKPTNYKFVVDCVSFESERDVWAALETVLRKFHGERNSPIPWLKIIPPSRQCDP